MTGFKTFHRTDARGRKVKMVSMRWRIVWYAILVNVGVVVTLAAGWGASYQERVDLIRKNDQLTWQGLTDRNDAKRSADALATAIKANDQMREDLVRTCWASNAILLRSSQWHAEQTGTQEAKAIQAEKKADNLGWTLHKTQEALEKVKSNWTSQLEVESGKAEK